MDQRIVNLVEALEDVTAMLVTWVWESGHDVDYICPVCGGCVVDDDPENIEHGAGGCELEDAIKRARVLITQVQRGEGGE